MSFLTLDRTLIVICWSHEPRWLRMQGWVACARVVPIHVMPRDDDPHRCQKETHAYDRTVHQRTTRGAPTRVLMS